MVITKVTAAISGLNQSTNAYLKKFLAALGMTIALYLYIASFCFAQKTKAQIKNVNFELVSDNLIVTYDIVKYKPKEMFTVAMNVYTAQENKIAARSLSGDINNNISGGEHKKIVWDVKKDSVFLDNDIYVEVIARAQVAASANGIEIPAVPDVTTVTDVPKPPVSTKAKTVKSVNLGKGLLLSSLYPGWGDYYIHPTKTFWVIGAAAYGLAAYSVVANRNAASGYSDYLASTQTDQRNDLYRDAVNNKQLSTFCIAAAAAIWVGDLTWVFIKSKKNAPAYTAIKKYGVSLGYAYHPAVGGKTLLSVKATF